MTDERRTSVLTEQDHKKIQDSFAESQTKFFELIGYDVRTPESRSAIREDHSFIRKLRERSGWIIATAAAAVIASGVAAAMGLG